MRTLVLAALVACKPTAPPPDDGGRTLGGEAAPDDGGGRTAARADWTSGIVEVQRQGDVVVLDSVEASQHEGFDQVVFTFRGGLPGHHLEYVDKPVRDCGSGDVVDVAGDGWLEVRLHPSAAHTEAGDATIPEREQLPGLPVVAEVQRTCDFEAVVTYVIGTNSPNRYRTTELLEPQRLVVDIQH